MLEIVRELVQVEIRIALSLHTVAPPPSSGGRRPTIENQQRTRIIFVVLPLKCSNFSQRNSVERTIRNRAGCGAVLTKILKTTLVSTMGTPPTCTITLERVSAYEDSKLKLISFLRTPFSSCCRVYLTMWEFIPSPPMGKATH